MIRKLVLPFIIVVECSILIDYPILSAFFDTKLSLVNIYLDLIKCFHAYSRGQHGANGFLSVQLNMVDFYCEDKNVFSSCSLLLVLINFKSGKRNDWP